MIYPFDLNECSNVEGGGFPIPRKQMKAESFVWKYILIKHEKYQMILINVKKIDERFVKVREKPNLTVIRSNNVMLTIYIAKWLLHGAFVLRNHINLQKYSVNTLNAIDQNKYIKVDQQTKNTMIAYSTM